METEEEQPLTLITITSPSFKNGGKIPAEFTCSGKGINPELHFGDIPDATRTLVLLVEDPDAAGKVFDHWVVFNIAPVGKIDQDTLPGTIGKNSKGDNRYHPPCPPNGTHRYYFKVYALDSLLYLDHEADKHTVMTEMENHVIGYGEIIGVFGK